MAQPKIVVVQAKNAKMLASDIEHAEDERPGFKVFWITEASDGGFTAFLRHVNA